MALEWFVVLISEPLGWALAGFGVTLLLDAIPIILPIYLFGRKVRWRIVWCSLLIMWPLNLVLFYLFRTENVKPPDMPIEIRGALGVFYFIVVTGFVLLSIRKRQKT